MKRKNTLFRIFGYLMRHKLPLFSVLALSLLGNLLALAGPRLSGEAINLISDGGVSGRMDMPQIYRYCLLLLFFYVCSSLMSYIVNVSMITLSRKITYTLRRDVFNHLVTLPVSYFDTNTTGDILSRISYDIDTINASLSNDVVQVVSSSVTIVGSLVMMLRISPPLVLVFTVTIPLALVLASYLTKMVQPMFRARSKAAGELNGYVEEMISGQKTLRAYTQEERVIKDMNVQNKKLVDAYYRTDYYASIMGPSTNAINNLALALISVFGAILYLRGHINIGGISAFVLYSRKFTGPIREIAEIYGELQSSLAAAERVFRILDEAAEPADRENALELLHAEGNVELSHVSFGYQKDRTILKDFSMTAPKGSLIAIVGPTGAGKTTFINLLMRFYDIDKGAILVDGHSSLDLTRKSLRLAYSMVLQDTWLFYGTIYENISYGRPEATREEVIAAAKAARIHTYIESLPQGYDTLLIDDGTNISKGQKQLLTIARALLMHSSMLILDEATSNVDTRTEHQIQAAMRSLMKDKTCFVVAHRLSTIRNADCILVVRDGNVIERGTHAELMKLGGFYYEMHQSQYQ
ncbi:MAG: ABC transporter ATP-binding protein [Lachnospiraceae bacterium]|jgi:ATP-binding cassette subfamily B multidrug efflux pump|nr:ABC transporter ATP-binding protein [Lachnospiraceae bacterium]NBJ83758.1 ABC transporter ATP-binding protein [bacterium 1XD42-76]NBK07019.1 ABC transporter ATP-binding protein [bacterium 1XD42-94]